MPDCGTDEEARYRACVSFGKVARRAALIASVAPSNFNSSYGRRLTGRISQPRSRTDTIRNCEFVLCFAHHAIVCGSCADKLARWSKTAFFASPSQFIALEDQIMPKNPFLTSRLRAALYCPAARKHLSQGKAAKSPLRWPPASPYRSLFDVRRRSRQSISRANNASLALSASSRSGPVYIPRTPSVLIRGRIAYLSGDDRSVLSLPATPCDRFCSIAQSFGPVLPFTQRIAFRSLLVRLRVNPSPLKTAHG